ncbi:MULTISPECIES: hypothetical protein [Rhodococcus]|nr:MULTISPECIES: hypothetical protein [Rhodococcus]
MVDWHATGLALAGVVLAAGGVWLRWRSPLRSTDRTSWAGATAPPRCL